MPSTGGPELEPEFDSRVGCEADDYWIEDRWDLSGIGGIDEIGE
jgi:hypothetical protein